MRNTTEVLRDLLVPAKQGLRANWLPGLVLQAVIFAIVFSYYQSADVRALLDRIGEVKRQWGFVYAACATAVFGGLIPFLVLLAMGRIERRHAPRELLFYVVFWCFKGVEVDAFYRLQGAVFGPGNAAGIIAAKMFVDQFVYNPLWASPSQAVCFLWKDSRFSIRETKMRLAEKNLKRRVLEILLSTWIIWIPAVCFIYVLPGALQLPLFNLVLCFWSLLLTFIVRGEATDNRNSGNTN